MTWLTPLFVCVLLAATAAEVWLTRRQVTFVARHRAQVPEPFAASVPLAEHQKAADYTAAKARASLVGSGIDLLLTLALTLGGGVELIDHFWRGVLGDGHPLWLGMAVIGSVVLLLQFVGLPLSLWRTFRIEGQFGFNRTTPALFCADLAKGLLLAVLLGGPLLAAILLLMRRAGAAWWLWAWALWLGFMLLMTWAWPTVIAPLFNRFSPLADGALRERIEGLLARCGFTSRGVFVVDNSRRSSHGNAYFTGIGRNKRIVFFDTLLTRLGHEEVEAVLAHELGHFRLHHVRQRLLLSVAGSFLALALLGWLAGQPGFYRALGVPVASDHAALLLFALAAPPFLFFLTPLSALWSRRHEFQADAFAAANASAAQLAAALVKLHRDNASTLTPDPWYSGFYYSHPPPLQRIGRLRELAPAGQGM
ncbi:MAG: M48 family metallopeptidase [Proteobacteria bacterium]|nr:M48 family metallopeptidase [Pseudomonadota bacterium]